MNNHNPADVFRINLNQNLWSVVISFSALGISEYYKLNILFWLSLILSVAMTLSVIVTTSAYTWNYCHDKFNK